MNQSRMRVRIRAQAVLAGAAAMLLTAVLAPAAMAKDYGRSRSSGSPDFEWAGRLREGSTIEIKGVNGSIVAAATNGEEVGVSAVKSARRSDPDEVRIEVNTHRNGVTICAVYPGRGNVCEPAEGGQNNTKNNDVRVDFEVKVPAGVRFVARTVNGSVRTDDLDGPIEAYTVNGEVEISSSGTATASTVNGSIAARLGVSRFDEDLRFDTVNGSITLECPRRIRAEVSASTVNGGIETDFPLTVRGRLSRHRLQGRIGDGGGSLRLATVNGGIRLLAANER